MKKIALAVATAAVVFTAAPLFAGAISAKAENVQMAQGIDVDIGRNREERIRPRRDRDDVTIGVRPGGVVVGPRNRCRTVTTKVERDDGRTVTRRERVCD
jgi:hypothetical protein